MSDENMVLLIDGHHGIYVPQVFAEKMNRDYVENVPEESWDILTEGPEHEHYWDVWTEVLDNARIRSHCGEGYYHLWQDGDLFIYIPATLH